MTGGSSLDDSLKHVRRFYTEDPFGNRIEFIQQGDGFGEPFLSYPNAGVVMSRAAQGPGHARHRVTK